MVGLVVSFGFVWFFFFYFVEYDSRWTSAKAKSLGRNAEMFKYGIGVSS